MSGFILGYERIIGRQKINTVPLLKAAADPPDETQKPATKRQTGEQEKAKTEVCGTRKDNNKSGEEKRCEISHADIQGARHVRRYDKVV